MKVLFLMNPPSPDRTPYLNGLSKSVWIWTSSTSKPPPRESRLGGTGASASSPRRLELQGGGNLGRTSAARGRGRRTCELRVPRLPFAAALTAARARHIPTVVRSDTNVDAIRAEPTWKRSARRAATRALIPKRTVAWAIGSKNSAFWKDEVGLSHVSLIPYEVLTLPGGAKPATRTRDPNDVLKILYVGRLVPVNGCRIS